MSNIVHKYLENYSEPLLSIPGNWNSVVAIPSRRESDDLQVCIGSLQNASKDKKNLAIVVINGSDSDLYQNQESWNQISSIGKAEDLSEDYRLIKTEALDILLINRFKDLFAFNTTEGVGLARKLGSDLALSLISNHQIQSTWIRSTDADVIVPKNYFDDPESFEKDISARIFSFSHSLPEDLILREAVKSYEDYLHYYKNGLQYARSPYAYHTVGSTLCIHSNAYAKVRGFPKRLAGEDFYLISKIIKMGKVVEDLSITLEIRGRLSERTPFGTGQSLKLISDKIRNQKDYLIYHPDIFKELKKLIELFEEMSRTEDLKTLKIEDRLGPELFTVCENLDIFKEIFGLHECSSSPSRRLKSFHTHFDALKTLRLINGLRDQTYRSIPIKEALQGLQSFDFRAI